MNRITAQWTPALDPQGSRLLDDSSWAPDESQSTFTIHVPTFSDAAGPAGEPFETQGWNIHLAIAQILGYSKYNGSGNNLIRWPPARHPLHPHLRATKITRCVGIGEYRRTLSPLSRMLPTGKTVYVQIPRVFELTILFQSLPYEVLEDSEITTERDRYVTTLINPTTEIITRQGGTYTFAEGPPSRDNPPIDFPQPIGLIYGTYDLIWVWHQVPREAIFSGMYPTRVQYMLGHVNSADVSLDYAEVGNREPPSGLFGSTYTEGQMLLTGVEITPEFAPVAPQIMGLGPLQIPRTYKISHRIKIDGNSHNKKPWAGDDIFYLVTIDGNPASKRIYRSIDFGLMFRPI